ncbi:MAG: hypothetical protein HC875_14860 [Anaerolineales bacterium]|nr:hypothetical protein [Anaerolineales bacterium]
MSKLYLEPPELSYLLQTMSARSVIGVDNSQLFPKDEAENEALLKQGLEQLVAHGWLINDESGKVRFNEALVYLIAVMADPKIAIMTTLQEVEGFYQLITHYLAGPVIVEQMRTTTNQYQLVAVPDIDTTVKRIQLAVRAMEENAAGVGMQISLNKQVFIQIKDLVKAGQTETAAAELQKRGMDKKIAESLVTALQTPFFTGTIVIFQRKMIRW